MKIISNFINNIVKWGRGVKKKSAIINVRQIEFCTALWVFYLGEIAKPVSLDPDNFYLIF